MNTWIPPYPELKITADASDEAHDEWKANCGPHSIAAACGLTLAEVRPHIPNYRGWMNPTQVGQTLGSIGRPYTFRKGLKTQKLCTGINRVQWEGSWLNPGVPPAAAYHHTHWVAHFDDPASEGGWVLCTAVCAWAWVHLAEWKKHNETRGDAWHITHHYGIKP
jgi:hypothetical protein